MVTNCVIRPATPKDMEAVFRLIKELAIYEKAEKEVTNTVDQLIEDGFGDNRLFKCNVAILEDEIIGFTLSYISYSTWKGKCLYLEDFCVTESWRNKGIGKLLFDHLYNEALEMNVARFEWQVLDWNKPAIEFYKKYKANLDATWINCKLILTSK